MRAFGPHPRRSFLQSLLLALPGVAAAPKRAPLPKPRFYWGVGIENCWMAQTDPVKDGQRRLLDVYLQMQHYDHWQQDLDLLAATGVNVIRYSVPWYRAEPKRGVYDWSWIDKPVDYLVNKLKIIPIMDLMHYGTPTWMADGVVDPRFAESLGRYAGAMAAHFRGLVNHYSPQNEPGLTCNYCGLTGRWPPYQKGVDSWAKIGVQVAKAMVLETWAIRSAIPDSVIVSVDAWSRDVVDGFLPKPADPELRKAAAVFPASLAYGKVKAGHPLEAFLDQHGASGREIAWFARNHAAPDIVGYNHYPDINDYNQFGDFTRHGSLPLDQAAKEAATLVGKGIREAHAYFNLPIYLTATSAGLADASKVAYINALCDMTQQLRGDGLPFVGINWWPLFDSIQWDYREKFDKPLKPFIYKGGWNNGLYVIGKAPGDELPRVKTPAVDAWRAAAGRMV